MVDETDDDGATARVEGRWCVDHAMRRTRAGNWKGSPFSFSPVNRRLVGMDAEALLEVLVVGTGCLACADRDMLVNWERRRTGVGVDGAGAVTVMRASWPAETTTRRGDVPERARVRRTSKRAGTSYSSSCFRWQRGATRPSTLAMHTAGILRMTAGLTGRLARAAARVTAAAETTVRRGEGPGAARIRRELKRAGALYSSWQWDATFVNTFAMGMTGTGGLTSTFNVTGSFARAATRAKAARDFLLISITP
ncbi:hypothetical protein B0H19DRAFT_1103693 [Mycena capillaripes]|nr:hypothetical protein B0H19DRAFT_1103693 [Mycena capillaripes]